MSSADRESALAGELIERLLRDPEFRAEFRRDPAAACVAAGLSDVAAELGGAAGSMDTLAARESRSSLAGVVMAVAVEGMGIAEARALVHHGLTGGPRSNLSHGGALRSPLGHVHRVGSPAALHHELGGLRGGSPGHGVSQLPAEGGGHGGGAEVSRERSTPAGSASAPAGPSGTAAAPGGSSSAAAAPPGGSSSATAAPSGGSSSPGGPFPGGSSSGGASAPAPPEPGAQPAHVGVAPVWPDERSAGGGGASAADASGGGASAAGASAVGANAAGGSGGGAGSALAGAAGSAAPGGGVGANGLLVVLENPGLSAPPDVRAFLTAGGADPRLVAVLGSALANHTIGLGQLEAVSDPVHVQAVDIVSVDGQPVGANNFAARDLVTEIAAIDPSVRPSEIGTPWPIHSHGFFSDARSADRLHLAFEMPGTDTSPVGAGAEAAGATASPGAGQVVYPPSSGVPLSSVVPAPVAASTSGSGVDAALAYARAMIGKLPESAGSNLGPQLDQFESDFGFHGAPWCGIFAGHVLEAAGLKVPHTVASVASILDLARNGDPPFVRGVLPVSEARPGDLVTFGGTEHVAVVTKVDGAGVHTIAGNTSQSNVSETTYPPSSVTGVVRPDYAAGKPGSIPGVWDYSGVQPPAAGGGANVPAAAAVAEAPGAGAAPAPPEQAADAPMPMPPETAAQQPGPFAASALQQPGPFQETAAQQPGPFPETAPQQPGSTAFILPASHVHGRNTVRFIPAVQPSPGSPLFAQAPRPVEVAERVIQQPSAAAAPQPVSGGLLDQAPAPTPTTGGSISVSSSLLSSGQAKFAGRLAELTGLDPRVVAAWELAEESGGAAQAREAASNFNWLNIGYFDSGAGKIAFDKTFGDPISAAEQSAKFLKGEWGGASPSIRAILNSAGHSPDEQMAAVANSDWASSHYGGGANLHGTYNELGDIHVENTPVR